MSRRIEPVTASLCQPLAHLHRACFPQDPWDARALGAILGLWGAFGRIAWEDDELLGFVLARDLGEEGEILSLGVAPARRGGGVGMALLTAAVDEARRRGLASVVLEVAKPNAVAQRLYRRAGFAQIACRRNYYRGPGDGIDALILRLCLGFA